MRRARRNGIQQGTGHSGKPRDNTKSADHEPLGTGERGCKYALNHAKIEKSIIRTRSMVSHTYGEWLSESTVLTTGPEWRVDTNVVETAEHRLKHDARARAYAQRRVNGCKRVKRKKTRTPEGSGDEHNTTVKYGAGTKKHKTKHTTGQARTGVRERTSFAAIARGWKRDAARSRVVEEVGGSTSRMFDTRRDVQRSNGGVAQTETFV
ncbi:unnamed protein product [Macrosiphum euphorbiae]|uniref:Uncharacterized protein n=1 Tax=Macrosiphum euphorbiae TaxID=13131 RepID=A0AAV0XN53_9HEMI|nr:unnamed protein product [Macrosiphum euphorbiae]